MTRWDAMMSRLKIGNVTSGWNVVQEVWSRRDAFENEKANRILRRYNSRGVPGGNFVAPILRNPTGPKRKAQESALTVTWTTSPRKMIVTLDFWMRLMEAVVGSPNDG